MNSVFMRQTSNPFLSEPLQKAFYCPTKPRALTKDEKKLCISPLRTQQREQSESEPSCKLHWDLDVVPTRVRDSDLSTSGTDSSRFDESWPSTEVSGDGQPSGDNEGELDGDGRPSGGNEGELDGDGRPSIGNEGELDGDGRPSGGNEGELDGDGRPSGDTEGELDGHGRPSGDNDEPPESTLAKYIHRFRHAPAAPRDTRDNPTGQFWWKAHQEVTPPKDQSTPTSSGGRRTPLIGPSLRVSSDVSLEERSQHLIDKSSSIFTSSTSSSLPAQNYFNRTNNDRVKPTLHRAPTNEEGDILLQWRLKRRLEEARREVETTGKEARLFHGRNVVLFDRQHHTESERELHRGSVDGGRLAGCNQFHRCEGELRQNVPPPVLHHPHLHSNAVSIPPHIHLACDVVPCPCCTATERLPGAEEKEEVGRSLCREAGRVVQMEEERGAAHSATDGGEASSKKHSKTPRRRQPNSNEPVAGQRETTQDHHLVGTEHRPHHSIVHDRRPPVKYPSPSILSKHKSRVSTSSIRQRQDPHASSNDALQTCESQDDDSLSDENPSLTFSSEMEMTPMATRGQMDAESGGPSIGAVVSESVQQHLFKSPSHTTTSPITATPTSKGQVARVPLEGPLPDIPWDDDLGDDLLKILIAKAKVFEAKLREVDRLLSAL